MVGRASRSGRDRSGGKALALVGIVFAFAAVSAPVPVAAAAGTVHDAFADFSSSSNPTPGGVWTYGYSSTLGGTLTAYPR